MGYSVEVIDGFRAVARNITMDVLRNVPPRPPEHWRHKGKNRVTYHDNNFADNPIPANTLPTYEVGEDKIRVFCGSKWAIMDFTNVRMKKIKSIEFSDPVKTNEVGQPVRVAQWRNSSDEDMPYSFKHAKESNKTECFTSSSELSLEIEYSLRTQVGGSVGIADVEMESQYTFRTSFTQRFESQKSKSDTVTDEEESSIVVPAWTKTSLMEKKTQTDWYQTITTTGTLDANVFISSDGDFGLEFASLHEMEQYFQGGGPPQRWGIINEYFGNRNHVNYQIDTTPLDMTVEREFRYRDVTVSDVDRVDTPLPNESTVRKLSDDELIIEVNRRGLSLSKGKEA